MAHKELLARHRAVMPKWLALYYDEPIEIASAVTRIAIAGTANPSLR